MLNLFVQYESFEYLDINRLLRYPHSSYRGVTKIRRSVRRFSGTDLYFRSLKIINLARRSVIQALVRPFVVVQEERSQVDSSFQWRPVFLQVHFLVLDSPPQPLDEDIIQHSASRPSMLILMPWFLRTFVNSWSVYCAAPGRC